MQQRESMDLAICTDTQFQGSTVSCKHSETIWLSWVVKLESGWSPVRTAFHILPHLSLPKLILRSSLFQVQDCHHFPKKKEKKKTTFDCSGSYSLILQSESTAGNDAGVDQQFSTSAPIFITYTICYHLWVFTALTRPCQYNIESSIKTKAICTFFSPHWQTTLCLQRVKVITRGSRNTGQSRCIPLTIECL